MSYHKYTKAVTGTKAVPVTLQATYAAANQTIVSLDDAIQCEIDLFYSIGTGSSSQSIQMKIEFANPVDEATLASTDFGQEINLLISSGTSTGLKNEYTFSTISASAGTYDMYPILSPIAAKYMRISIKETKTGGAFGTAYVNITQVKLH